jgi:FkbM family methyltransferase
MNIGPANDPANSGEAFVLQRIASELKQNSIPVVFDVGANVGEYAFEVLNILSPAAQLHCFEPAKWTFDRLRTRFGSNPRVHLHNIGFSASAGEAALYSDTECSGIASMYDRDLSSVGRQYAGSESIRLDTIDAFCEAQRIERIHLLKLDVEGHELCALTGAARMLREKRIKWIQFEFGGCNIDSRTYLKDFFDLLNADYQLSRILRSGLAPIQTYREMPEIFVTTNYLAALREESI